MSKAIPIANWFRLPIGAVGNALSEIGNWQSAIEKLTPRTWTTMTRTVIAAVEDMLFAAKIRATATHLDVTVRSVRNAETLLKVVRESGADLIIVDLHAEQVDPIAVARALKSDEQLKSIRLLGFFSHVRGDLQQAAVAAGYDVVIPRSVFSRDLAEILEGKSGGS